MEPVSSKFLTEPLEPSDGAVHEVRILLVEELKAFETPDGEADLEAGCLSCS